MFLFLVFIIGIGYFFSLYYGNPVILIVAVIFSLLMNFFSYWYSDKLVLSMYKAKEVARDEMPGLWNITENLAITAGIPMPKLYVIPESQPNAFATGRNKEHASIAVTSGILEVLDRTELEGVIAHEMGHITNKDILLQTVIVVLVGMVAIASDLFWRTTLYGGRGDDSKNKNGVILAIGLVLMILSPIVATIIQLAISRKREFLADATGALLTRYPEGLASALEKISASPTDMKRANHSTAHLFISSPFNSKKQKISMMTKLFMTHPPVEERIAKLRGI